jgi:PAS domain S-box-containing protein
MITLAINQYQQLFDQGISPRCLVTLEGDFVLTNSAFRKMFHLIGTHMELTKFNLFDVLSEATGIHKEKIRKDQLFYSETEEAMEGKIIIINDDGSKMKLDYLRSRVEIENLPMLTFEWQDVTEKVEYRKSLRSTYERLQLAASISNLGIWEYEFETREWYLNEWMCALFKIPAHGKTDITKSIVSTIFPEDLEVLTQKWLAVKEKGDQLDFEFRIVLPDTGVHYLHILGRCLFDTRHQPWKFVGTMADITAHKKASEEIILDRNRMRSLIDAQNSLLIRLNQSGLVTYSNLSFRNYFGIENMCSKSIWESPFLHADQRDLLHKTLDKCFSKPGVPHQLILKLKNAKGESKIQEWELVGIENNSGLTDEVQGIGKDVTSQHILTSQLKQTNSNLESLINNFNTISIWSVDLEYNLTTCNSRMSRDFELFYTSKINQGDNIIQALKAFPEVQEFWKSQYSRAFNGEQFDLELDLGDRFFEVSFNPIRTGDEITGAAIYGMEITESKKAERDLRLSEERLHFAIEGNQYGVWDYDVVNDHLYLSASCREMLELNEDEVSHNLMDWTTIIHPNDLNEASQIRRNLLEGKIDGFRNEVRMRTKSGVYKWIMDKGKTYERDANGKPTRVIGLFLDISQNKADEAKLKEYLQRLEKFAYITSHNLRLPVANIIGLSNMIDEKSLKSKDDETLIRKIRSSAQQIDDVIKEMNDAISFSNQQALQPQLTSLQNIWFIDDDDINNMLSERLINKHFPNTGCKTFLDAEEALEILQKTPIQKPDAIFLDINMPRMNGWEFLEELQKLNVSVNVYMLTSSIDPRDQQKAHEYKLVKDFISKPLREERLRLIVE